MNMQIKIVFIGMIVISSLFYPFGAYAHDQIFPEEKLKVLVPQAESFEQRNLYMSDEQRLEIEKALKTGLPEEDLKPSLYFAVVRQTKDSPPRKEAAVLFIDAYGEGGKIEIGVAVNRNGDLMRIHIFENSESENLSHQAFLNQYEGKKASDAFMVGADITAPAGKEKDAQAIASGVRRGVLIINELLRKK